MSWSLGRNPLRRAGERVDVPVAAAAWLCAWLVATVIGVVVLSIGGYDTASEAAIWVLFLATALGWLVFAFAMVTASRLDGSGSFVADYHARAKPIDIVGVVPGVLAQLLLVPVIYLPLSELWPATFDEDRLSENARDLVERATGGSMVLLIAMVCVGAPLIEELVYRGMLQGSLASRFSQMPALVVASAWFALIHLRPVEYPGLFAAGLVFGGCMLVTGRVGTAIAAHAAFNVTGLILAS